MSNIKDLEDKLAKINSNINEYYKFFNILGNNRDAINEIKQKYSEFSNHEENLDDTNNKYFDKYVNAKKEYDEIVNELNNITNAKKYQENSSYDNDNYFAAIQQYKYAPYVYEMSDGVKYDSKTYNKKKDETEKKLKKKKRICKLYQIYVSIK